MNAPKDEQPLSERDIANMMLSAPVSYIVHGNDGKQPSMQILQESLHMLATDQRELVGSQLRHRVVDHIAASKPQQSTIRRALSRLFGRKDPHPVLDDEIRWLQENGDQQSFTVLASEADLLMERGDEEAAKKKYREALRRVRETGETVME